MTAPSPAPSGQTQGRVAVVIVVSEEQLKQVEYLLQQSRQGNHVLFDQASVRAVFNRKGGAPISDEEAHAVEHHIERVILLPTLAQKRIYLEKLDFDTYAAVVRTYFTIVENNLLEASELDETTEVTH